MKLPSSFYFLRPGWWGIHAVAIALVGGAGFAAGSHHDEHAHHEPHHVEAASPPDPSKPANPVQHEMQLLSGALATAPASFAAGDLRPLLHQLHSVHAAKEATEAAIEHGSYRLPKNADELPRFHRLDEEFHARLEKLAEHAAKNELGPAATAYGQVLGGCNGCHSEFRSP
jgi:cytochrome c556